FLSGQGRSGNMVRALAIRFMHIGVQVHVAGEPTTPAIGAGDLLVAVSASARTKATLEHIQVARKVGAGVALVTTVADAPDSIDRVLRLPVRSAVPSAQHAGSLFEQTILLLGDSLAWHVQRQLGVDDAALDARHANLQ
ncbi:MAG: SIS domain-containing protein, partial [Comamonadaceae bacterium]